MKKNIWWGAAALSLGLACSVSAQKKGVGYLGPPVRDGEPTKTKPRDTGKKTDQPVISGPQSGTAAGFGIGTPGGQVISGQPGVAQSADDVRRSSTDNTPQDKTRRPVTTTAPNGAEIDAPIGGPPTKKAAPNMMMDDDNKVAAGAPARKKTAKVKVKRARHLRRG